MANDLWRLLIFPLQDDRDALTVRELTINGTRYIFVYRIVDETV
nr:hypothetical protein [uncultured Devosia sp.]